MQNEIEKNCSNGEVIVRTELPIAKLITSGFTLLATLGIVSTAGAGVVAPKDRPHQGGPLQYGCRTDDCVMIEGMRIMHSKAPAARAEQRRALEAVFASKVESPPFIPPESRTRVAAALENMMSTASNKSATVASARWFKYVGGGDDLYCGTALYDGANPGRFVVVPRTPVMASTFNFHATADAWMRAGCNGDGLALR
jgi:hypothetical protein